MHEANETLRAVRNQKMIITKSYNDAKKKLNSKYNHDMSVLNEQEKELLTQLNEVPNNEISNPVSKKYRKKPVIIEAYQSVDGETIETLEGTMTAKPGDYIITGVHGEKYPCNEEIFYETYEEVE